MQVVPFGLRTSNLRNGMDGAAPEEIQLKVFGQQVGGHSLLLKLSDQAVCKPLLSREQCFYESIPLELRNYTPEYYGIVSVRFIPAKDECIAFAHPKAIRPSPEAEMTANSALRLHIACSEELDSNGKAETFINSVSRGNPWSALCLQTMTNRLKEFQENSENLQQDYMVLENLTAKYRCPCILDLKVGTRQHGDDASEEKKIRHTRMCANSTSLSFGVRLCGVQMFNAATSEYVFRDKYYGRQLDEAQFLGALKDFLYDGTSYRTDIVPELIETLKQLREVIKSLASYRLFSGSLMIIYDGQKTSSGEGGEPPSVGTPGLQDVSMKGLPNSWISKGLWPNRSAKSPWHTKPELLKFRQKVDVRLIDFAHTTHAGFVHDPVKHEGPDEGYITGLTTLISAFENMF